MVVPAASSLSTAYSMISSSSSSFLVCDHHQYYCLCTTCLGCVAGGGFTTCGGASSNSSTMSLLAHLAHFLKLKVGIIPKQAVIRQNHSTVVKLSCGCDTSHSRVTYVARRKSMTSSSVTRLARSSSCCFSTDVFLVCCR